MVTVKKNKFDTLQETSERHTPTEEYENFVPAHIKADVGGIPNKPRDKCRVPCKSLVVGKKGDDLKKHLYSMKETQQMLIYRNLR